jgi:hypothetical protein
VSSWHDAGKAEVGDLGVHVGVKEHVAQLDVAVDDRQAAVVVQVCEAGRDARRDTQSTSILPLPPFPCSASYRLPLTMYSDSTIVSKLLLTYPSMRTTLRCRSRPRRFTSTANSPPACFSSRPSAVAASSGTRPRATAS